MDTDINKTSTMNNFLQKQEAFSFYCVVTSLVILILTLVIFALNYQNLPSQIPLFYSLPWGQEQLVSVHQFIILPAIIILTILINLVVSWHLHPQQKVLKRTLAASTTIVSLLILITTLKIIYTFV